LPPFGEGKIMKKFAHIVLIAVSALFVISGTGLAQTSAPVILRFAEIHEPAYPTTVGDFEIAKLVKERTKGRVIIEIHHSMKLGDEAAVIKKVQDGEIDLTRINIGPVTKYIPSLNAFLMPYVFTDTRHMLKVVNGAVGNDVLKDAEKNNFIGFGWFDGGTRNFYTKTPVKVPADLRALRIRSLQNDLMIAMMTDLGVKAIPLPHGETYQALKDGKLDGAENNYPTYEETNHYQLAKYFIEDEHTRNPDIIIGSKKALLAKLTPREIEIIKRATRDAQRLQFKLWAETVEKSKQKVVAAGCVVTTVNPEQKKAFAAAVQPIYDQQPAEIKALVKRIQAVK
jgi:TRAP-type C4-dicarboxylate transport system substrate-binding protein